jgi:hypothetical protein
MEFHDARLKSIGPAADAADAAERPCRAALADDGLFVLPEGRSEIYLYYSDIDRVIDDDYRIRVEAYDGRSYVLSHLGSFYGQFLSDLRRKRRDQLIPNLLMLDEGFQKDFACAYRLEDAEGVRSEDRTSRIALYQNSLVVYPDLADPFNFAYADLEGHAFDEPTYSLTLRFDLGERLVLSMMGKRFREFEQDLVRLVDAMYERSAALLAAALPGAQEGTLLSLARVLRRGKATSRAAIEAVSPGLWDRLLDVAFVDEKGKKSPLRRSSFDWLAARTTPDLTYLGVRESSGAARAEAGSGAAEDDADGVVVYGGSGTVTDGAPSTVTDGASDSPAPRALYWFLVALPEHNAIAAEVTNEKGHATYFYRIAGNGRPTSEEIHRRVRQLSRAMQALNFRREVIYAKERDLASGRMFRYRVALRKLSYLRDVRQLFVGRATHQSEAAWEKRAASLLEESARG